MASSFRDPETRHGEQQVLATEGDRYGLSPDVSREIADRVCQEATDRYGRFDLGHARSRFHAIAARAMRLGGRLQRDPGKGPAIGDTHEDAADAFGELVPGKGPTLAELEYNWRATQQRGVAPSVGRGEPDQQKIEALQGDGHLESAGAAGIDAQGEAAFTSLPTEIRGELEAATGVSLGHVRLHHGERGNAVAAEHGARAVAIASDIYIAAGQPGPSSPEGRELIAHEVAHVVQAEAHPGPQQAAAKREEDLQPQVSGGELGQSNAEDPVHAAEVEANAFALQFRTRGGAMSWRPSVGVDGGMPMRSTITMGEVARRLGLQSAPDVAFAYLRANQVQVLEAITRRLGAMTPPAHERLAWQPGGVAAAFTGALMHSLDGNQLFARLPELLHPTNPWTVIDQNRSLTEGQPGVIVDGREPKGPLTWSPAAGDALAIEVATRVRESLARMTPRYAAQLETQRTAPVTVADLIASHPMDRVTSQLLCDPRVVAPRAGAASPANPSSDPAFRDGLRRVEGVTWLGERDPKLWNWIEVEQPRDATAEEVAATLLRERDDEPPPSHLAYLVTPSAPWFRIDPPWARKLLGSKAPPPSGPDKPHDDHALALAESELATDAAIAQAADERRVDRRGVAVPPDFARVGDVLDQSYRQLERAKELLAPWRLWQQTLPALNWVAKYREHLMGLSKERLAALTPVIEGQQALLFQAVGEVQEIAAVGGRAASIDGDAGPITNVLRSFAVAIGESHLIDSARAQLATAHEAKAGLTLALLDRSLTESHDAVRELAGSETKELHYGGADAASRHATYQRQLLDLRGQRAMGEAVDPGATSLLAANLKEHTLDTKVKSLYVQMHQLMEQMRASTFGGEETIASFFDSDARGLPKKIQALISGLHEGVLGPWEKDKKARQSIDQRTLAWATDNDTRTAQQRFDGFIAESGIADLFRRAVDALERQQVRTVIVGTVVRIAALVGVSALGGMAGSLVGGAVRGAMIADAAVASDAMIVATHAVSTAAGIAADATVTTAGQMIFQGGGAKEEWLINFFSSAAVLVALKPIHGAAAHLPTAGSKVHKAAVLTAEMITAAAISHSVERALRDGTPDIQTAGSWLAQGAAMAVGKFISTRLTGIEQRLGKLAEYGAHKLHTRKLRELAAHVEKTQDPASAVELLAQHTKLLNEEAELLASRSKELPPETLRALSAENHAERTAPRDASTAMLPLYAAGLAPDDASGKVWTGASDDIFVALDRARLSGIRVDVIDHDAATRRWRVQYNDRELTLLGVTHRGASGTASDPSASSTVLSNATPEESSIFKQVLALDPIEGQRLIEEYRDDLVEYLRAHPLTTLGELSTALTKQRAQVKSRVKGLYEGIDVTEPPFGWKFHTAGPEIEFNGTRRVRTTVDGPNGARGVFERAYHPVDKTLELREAFLKMGGNDTSLPNMITKQGTSQEMIEGKGTPTVQYVTIYQMKLLGVPIGATAGSPGVETMHMSSIQNVETVVHLHYLISKHGRDPADLVELTQSVKYAETTLVQSGYRRAGAPLLSGGGKSPIRKLLEFQEGGNSQRRIENDKILTKYGFDRDTVMLWNFDIDFNVAPVQDGTP